MQTFFHDLRHTIRVLRKYPGFTAAAVATLALAIGTNTTIFSIVNGLLLRPLPYPHQERLLQLSETFPDMESVDLSYPDFAFWKQNTWVFEDMGAFDDTRFLLGGESTEIIDGAVVTAGLFSALEVKPFRGRNFLPGEDRPGGSRAAMVSCGLWQRRFGADESLVGEQIILNGRSTTVIGIMPPGFGFPEYVDLWLPLALDPVEADRNDYSFDVIGRMKPEASVTEAQSEAEWIAKQLAQEYPDTKKSLGAVVYPLRSADVNDKMALAALVLLGSVGFVLLIACVNVTNLMFSRALERENEIAVRLALGASRRRLIYQMLTESLLLASLGAAGGLLGACWGKDLLFASIPERLPFWIRFDLDARVLAFVLLVTTVATLLSGLAPAIQSSKVAPNSSLNQGGVSFSFGIKRRSVSGLMVVSQIALATTLLTAAGHMIRSFILLQAVDPGAETRNILTMTVILPPFKYQEKAQSLAFYDRLLDEVSTLPLVRRAALSSKLPLSGFDNEVAFVPEGSTVD